MTPSRIIVTGLGRCGSSLTMQMLAAGGMPSVGRYPDFEVDRATPDSITEAWLKTQTGAVKVLDPHRIRPHLLGLPDQRIIWLARDMREQAKSQAKFLRIAAGRAVNRQQAKGLERLLRSDTATCHRLLSTLPIPVLRLTFEHLITHPEGAASTIAAFVAPLWLDVGAMARVVVPRSGACLPDMLELSLLDGAA
ncbi:hypothetical protein SAMN05216456_1344 [Devosia crocina]|uniref:Sulfotransferase family protein n=1 Tax=Devosia crocina TaxID=429728 RepID=A0A1I7N9X2_9HYPH|nr:hypothetical protein [Devosia crocina]SFV31448.1 hypothetical protein SAMN05216456_1344 [Devosia crocina]